MTKQEAIQAMEHGHTVRHEYFSSGEWMMKGGKGYIFEDGVSCFEGSFWKDRCSEEWDTGWDVVKV